MNGCQGENKLRERERDRDRGKKGSLLLFIEYVFINFAGAQNYLSTIKFIVVVILQRELF